MNKSLKMASLLVLVVSNSCFSIGWPKSLNFGGNGWLSKQNILAIAGLMLIPTIGFTGTKIYRNKYDTDTKAWNTDISPYIKTGLGTGVVCTAFYFKFLKESPEKILAKLAKDSTNHVVSKSIDTLIAHLKG